MLQMGRLQMDSVGAHARNADASLEKLVEAEKKCLPVYS